jgi:hypothetical protein
MHQLAHPFSVQPTHPAVFGWFTTTFGWSRQEIQVVIIHMSLLTMMVTMMVVPLMSDA